MKSAVVRPARTCQAAYDVLELNLIINALAGESMSSATSLHSWPGPWGFAPHSSSPAHMGVIAQKLSNWNQWKGKAWNLGKAEHSCSELQNRLSTFADTEPRRIEQAFAREATKKEGQQRSLAWEDFSLGQNVYLKSESFLALQLFHMCLHWSGQRPYFPLLLGLYFYLNSSLWWPCWTLCW